MVYDEALAARVRRALAGRNDVIEKRMFGGLTFMLAGHMCCGVHSNELIIRLDAKTSVEDLNSPHVRPWDFMRRAMRGMFAVAPGGCADQLACNRWVQLAVRHASSLMPK
jgi:hypothetical protein